MPNSPLPPYARGSATSRDAAEAMRPKRRKQALLILDLFHATPLDGLTSDEVEVALHLPHQSASARINELRDAGCLIESRMRRKTRAGAEAAVYVLAPDATDEKFERWLAGRRDLQHQRRVEELWQKRLNQAAANYAMKQSVQHMNELAMVARQIPVSLMPQPEPRSDEEIEDEVLSQFG